MQRYTLLFVFTVLLLLPVSPVSAQDSWTAEQQEVLASMELLSAATAPDGAGADDYAAILAEGFSRWTTGRGKIKDKQVWVDGVRGWFEDGWRVVDRNQEVLEVSVSGEYAFSRRIVEETYQGPDGESSVSKAGVAETWVRGAGPWLLLRVNVVVLTGE